MDIAPGLFLTSVGFILIGCLTRFFSTRRRAFIRTFVPPDEREAIKRILRDQHYTQGMRFIAYLQIVLGILLLIGSGCAWWILSA